MQTEFLSPPAAAGRHGRYIYLAAPLTPMGGGMFRVADYLMQAQAPANDGSAATLRPLETRGGGSAVWSWAFLLAALAKILHGRITGRLAGVHVNMAERLSLVRKGVIIVVCRALGVPVLLHLHAGELHRHYQAMPATAQALVRWLFSLPASCVVLGKASSKFVTEQLKVPAHRVHIVINGVPKPMVARRDAGAVTRQRVLFVGNLSERKGVSDLLHALAQPQFHGKALEVTFVGGGDVAAYRSLASRLGLRGWVHFEGWVNQDAVASFLASADVLVLPSHDEGLPLAVLEALAQGVAVVCTPVGEIPHVLTDGIDACFVQPGNAESIAQGLHKVLSNGGFRETLERKGRALYERQFSLTGFCASIARLHQYHFGICGMGMLSDPVTPARAS